MECGAASLQNSFWKFDFPSAVEETFRKHFILIMIISFIAIPK